MHCLQLKYLSHTREQKKEYFSGSSCFKYWGSHQATHDRSHTY